VFGKRAKHLEAGESGFGRTGHRRLKTDHVLEAYKAAGIGRKARKVVPQLLQLADAIYLSILVPNLQTHCRWITN
jgi:hypothetical protein